MRLFLPSSRWLCFNGGFNMASVTPTWGVNDKMSLQRYGGLLLSCNALLLIVGEWPHLCQAVIPGWVKINVTLVHYLFYG